MFKEFEAPELPLASHAPCADPPHVGFLRIGKRRWRIVGALAAVAILGSCLTAVVTTDRCDTALGKWTPSIFAPDCQCSALLLEDGSPLLLESGGKLCLSR